MRIHRFLLLAVCATCLAAWTRGQEPRTPTASKDIRLSASASNSVEVQAGEVHERIRALRDNVLRVTIWRGAKAPEDASWAVLADARQASTPLTHSDDGAHITATTAAMTVEIDKKTLELTIRDASGKLLQHDGRPIRFDGDAFRIYKAMPADEHFFGLGDKTGAFDRRDQAFTLWNTDAYRFQDTTDPLYKSIPFFLTYRAGQSLGILLDNTWRASFDFGKESPDLYSFGSVAGPIDYYVLGGPTAKDVMKEYAWLTGTAPLPPLWALGFQQSRYSYMSQSRVLEVANRLRKDHIPSDAIYLDIDFQEKNRPFTVDTAAFPDLAGMVSQLHAEHFHVVAITDLHIANLPGHGYSAFDSGIAGDHFVKDTAGHVFTGRVWPGPSVFPDFTRQETRKWWGSLYRDFKHVGIDGFWNDMNEPSVFDTANHTIPESALHRIDEPGFSPRIATHAEVHDVYGMENARATFDGLRTLEPNQRPFVLTRAAYAGAQRYAATWTGDNSSTWNHLRLTVPMLKNLGLSGFAFSGADVGGYAGDPSPELLTKWFEIGAFQPIDRDHAEKGKDDQEPWVNGDEQENIRRRFVETRYQLLPYLYTLAEEASRTGLPIMRPLFLEFPDAAPDRHPLDIDVSAASEFMLGSNLLIAPSPFPDERGPYTVEFPSKGWYDFWTGEKIAIPAETSAVHPDPVAVSSSAPPLSLNVTPELSKLPVFVRAGSILPIDPVVQSTDITPSGRLVLRVYAGDDCKGSLYQDDGKTYAFTKGAYLRMSFACDVTPDGLHVSISPHEGSYPAWWKEIHVETYGWNPKQGSVVVNAKNTSMNVDHHGADLAFDVADDGKGVDILLQ